MITLATRFLSQYQIYHLKHKKGIGSVILCSAFSRPDTNEKNVDVNRYQELFTYLSPVGSDSSAHRTRRNFPDNLVNLFAA